jgi:hypothetical protein
VEHIARMVEMLNAYNILVRKTEGMRSLGIFMHMRKMVFK